MNWRITPRPPLRVTWPLSGCVSPAMTRMQRGLAGAVGPDQGDLGALTDPEVDVVEQHPPVGQDVTELADVDVAHATSVPDLSTWTSVSVVAEPGRKV